MERRLRLLLREIFLGPVWAPNSLLDLPNELIIQLAKSLGLRDINGLLRTNHFLQALLSPVPTKRGIAPTTHFGYKGRTLLHWASARNRSSLMEQLLEDRDHANVNAVDSFRATALHSAVLHGYETVTMLLLENGADTEIEGQFRGTPLLWAAISGNATACRMLLEKGGNTQASPPGFHEQTALHLAAGLGYIDVVNVLVEMGCNTRAVDNYGTDAVQVAAFFGQEEVVERLLGPGGFCRAPDIHQSLATYYCSPESQKEDSMRATRVRVYLYKGSLRYD